MACLRCGCMCEEGPLLCDACADASFEDPRFFLNPSLIGRSVFQRMRSEGSATMLLGPTSCSDTMCIPSVDLQKMVSETGVNGMTPEELKGFYEQCNTILAHLGVPLKFDLPFILITEDAAQTITTIIRKVEQAEQLYPNEGMSDLYLRMGLVYWYAFHGILMRTASKDWANAKKKLLRSRARDYMARVTQTDDLSSIATYNMGMLAVDAGDWADAEMHLSNALKHFPNDRKIIESLAKSQLELGNPMDAMARIDDALALEETQRLWVLKGRVLRDLNKPQEALDCFSRSLSLDSRFIEAYDHIIVVLHELGRTEDASVAERQRAMARTPDLDQKVTDLISELKKASAETTVGAPPRHFIHIAEEPKVEVQVESYPAELAREALRSGNYDSAIQMAEHILREEPGSVDAQLTLIESLVKTNDLARADHVAHTFYENNRSDPRSWYWRGVLAENEGKWGASVQYFSKAVSLDPRQIDAWVLMGDALLKNGKVSGADESYSRALQINGNYPRAWLGKAKAMRELGRWGAAIQCLDKYNMLEPRDKDSWLLKADILFEKEKHRRAVEAYDRFLELDQDDSHALGRKGIALNAIGMQDEARKCLEEAVRLDSTNRDAAKWLKTLDGGDE